MENNETVLAKWEVSRDHVLFVAIIVTITLFCFFAFSFWAVYIFSKSTSIVFLIIPIILLLLFLAALPELFKSFGSAPENAEIYITDKGVYRRRSQKEEYQFISWAQMSSYDMCYLASTSPLGKLFPRSTQFILKSKYEEDNFVVDAFGEDVDILRTHLKENNVPFGFMKTS